MLTSCLFRPTVAPDMSGKRRSQNPRSMMRRLVDGPTVTQQRFHMSESLQSSRDWFLKEINYQQQRGVPFEDPFMPPTDATINPNRGSSGQFRWLRPREITPNAQFVTDGISRFDVNQGEIGDCWFLAAVSCLSMHNELFCQVVPPGQSFDRSRSGFPYVGMFWFRFWQFGDWVDVVIDDRLPTRSGRLVFMHSSDRNEFWSALLEKAYAKLIGSYDALRGGSTAEAMEDFTGGLTELVDLGQSTPPNLFSIMERSNSRSSLMACSIDAAPDQIEASGPMGLIMGHAYSITDVRRVNRQTGGGPVQLVRLRNPWGNDREWSGPWSDQSSEWRSISATERQRIGLTFDADGEFWMSFNDFCRHFSRIEMCHLGPETEASGPCPPKRPRRWEMTKEEGEWLRHSTAGGCRNFLETFHMNPQFHIEVIDPDETDDEDYGTIVVGLMQKGMRERRREPHVIGYSIYRMPQNAPYDRLLDKSFFRITSSVARSPNFINMREVCGRHKLQPGPYVIIPSTFNPNEEAKFILRIFSERACKSNELDDVTRIISAVLPVQPPTTADENLAAQLRQAFSLVAGASNDITASELKDILNTTFVNDFRFDGFSTETARSMVALMDTDLSGTLGFEEFKKLWMELRLWKTIFKKFDRGTTGTLNAFELRQVMSTVGFTVSNRIYKAITCRYATPDGQILFDDYVLLLVRLMTVFETFKAQERLSDGRAVFGSEDFIRSVIYI